jgi:hypothetical protein
MYDQPDYMATAVIHDRRQIDWKTLGAYALAALGVGFGIACLLLFIGYKNTVSGQLSHIGQAVQNEQSARANEYKSLNGKVAATDSVINDLTQFSSVCSQDLTGPNGPAQFDFPCKQH